MWEPKNYTGDYDGPITMREALTRSKNTATVRLAQEVGIGAVIQIAQELGITTPDPQRPATALGAAEVRPDRAGARRTRPSPTAGSASEPHLIRTIVDRNGEVRLGGRAGSASGCSTPPPRSC